MKHKVSDRQVLYFHQNKEAFESKVKELKSKLRQIKEELEKYEDRISFAGRVDEIFEGVPLSTRFHIQVVSDSTDRYAEHPYEMKNKSGLWAFTYGREQSRKETETWTGPIFKSEDQAWTAARRWVVLAEDPKEGKE